MRAWAKFKKSIADNNLITQNSAVLVAVSGGPDSVCLLHMLWRLKKTLPFKLFVATFDHALRKNSAGEAAFVQKLCSKLKVKCMSEKLEVLKYSKRHKLSLETAGRQMRYNALEKYAKLFKCDKIATAHNANDNAETLLMWLIRGTGLDGLAGIPIRRTFSNMGLIRPLLSIERNEILSYLKNQKLKYRIDPSNKSIEFTRNKIRKAIIPVFESINPLFVEHAFKLSRIVEAQNIVLNSMAQSAKKRCLKVSKNGRIFLDLRRFLEYNKLLKLHIIKDLLSYGRTSNNIERTYRWFCSCENGTLVLNKSTQIIKKANQAVFVFKKNEKI
ncbi:MAG: tRNA lysidine(34) synthetase TilS [Endomicrobiales bacterium]|nr:tRNA lysidine(34) synthetase TilS [Endomicrobiales bacterium]